MAFPSSPSNNDYYTNPLGTVYQYKSSRNAWNIVSQNYGATGIQGATGLIGGTGVQGIQGNTGVQGITGFHGITGLQGIQGITGVAGITGVRGITGANGLTGVQGLQGLTGIQGTTGVQGTTGLQGNTGFHGNTGLQGITGFQQSTIISRGGVFYNEGGITAANVIAWRAPFACAITNVRGYRVGGTAATFNARRNDGTNHLSVNCATTNASTWYDGTNLQNTAYAVGDKLEVMAVSVTGTVTQLAIQVDMTRT